MRLKNSLKQLQLIFRARLAASLVNWDNTRMAQTSFSQHYFRLGNCIELCSLAPRKRFEIKAGKFAFAFLL
jgi:hypothetical protein